MSITSEITRINTNISNAYTACDNKGATMPVTQNSANLATCIDSIPSGGGGSTLITKTITANGTYNASSDNADGYSSVTVNVSGGGGDFVPTFANPDAVSPHFIEYIYSEGEMSFEQDDFQLEGLIGSIICNSWGRRRSLSIEIGDLYEIYRLGTSALFIDSSGDVFTDFEDYGVTSIEVYWHFAAGVDAFDIYLYGANDELTNIYLVK